MSSAKPTAPAQGLISARLAFALIAVALVAFAGALSLAAWSPELQDKNKAGAHAFSDSATGYKAFGDLLERDGWKVEHKRNAERRTLGLNFITPPPYVSEPAVRDVMDVAARNIIILPKWYGRTDSDRPSWFEDTNLIEENALDRFVDRIMDGATFERVDPPEYAEFEGRRYSLSILESLQVFSNATGEVLVNTPTGPIVVRDLKSDAIYVSDPDLFNTLGMAHLDHARLALALTRSVGDSGASITFDVTLNGFVMETSLLRLLLDVPFLAVSLISLAGALMLGWAASIRFGSADRDERAHALGKEALADHTAALFKLARREVRMAPGYLELQKAFVCERLGIPKHLSEDEKTQWLDRLSEQADLPAFSKLEARMKTPSRDRLDLIQRAQNLFVWRQEILNETE